MGTPRPLAMGVPSRAGHQRVVFTMCLAVAALYARAGDAKRPSHADAWTAGLAPAGTSAPADGTLALRVVPAGRVRIPGGTFTMGSSAAEMLAAIELCEREIRAAQCHDPELVAMVRAQGSAHTVTLSSFELDRVEVTVAEYRRCVAVGTCSPPQPPDDVTWAGNIPVTYVRWEDASTYCRWAAGRLPTEAEWEYAARGSEGREFPWGHIYNPHLANHGAWANDPTDRTDGYVGLAPVGSFPSGATPLGVLDLAGNAAEWVADVFEFDAAGRPVGYLPDAQIDPPPHAAGGGLHVVRGGSYIDAPMWLRGAARQAVLVSRSPWVGFRCAADVR
jgi:formylglycine-generating enzyme required for sulfatase activity